MSNDKYRIDSHKLMLHPQRVADWLAGKQIAPIYMEVSPSGSCNHRCIFCALDFMEYKPRFIPLALWQQRVHEMGQMGLKAIMFAGEGEPFLHKQMVELATSTKEAGIDISFTTNAVLLTPAIAAKILPITSWIKVSCNAGTPSTYAQIHRTQSEDFSRVLCNLENAANLRQKLNSQCTLGFQMVLLPENLNEAVTLAHTVRNLGADYLVIKPYSQHPQSYTQKYQGLHYDALEQLSNALQELETPAFRTIFRWQAMQHWDARKKSYDKCLALPFWSYIDAGCNVWGCSMFLGDEHFAYGNLADSSFNEIWHGQKRKASLDWCARELDAQACRINCRMDSINAYLHELRYPNEHVNFI